jgi:hypothetical protein
MVQQIATVQTIIPTGDNDVTRRTNGLVQREDDLNAWGRRGYSLTHTVVITGAERATFVDTMATADEGK